MGAGGQLRAVFWFYPHVRVDFVVDAFAIEALPDLSHGIELVHGLVSDNTDSFRAQVLEIHANFLGGTSTEPDGGRRHFKGILLEVRIRRRGIATTSSVLSVGEGGGRTPVVVARIGVAWTRWRMSVLDGAEEARSSLGGLGSRLWLVTYACQAKHHLRGEEMGEAIHLELL